MAFEMLPAALLSVTTTVLTRWLDVQAQRNNLLAMMFFIGRREAGGLPSRDMKHKRAS